MKTHRIATGQVWREVDSGRLVRILEEEVYGTGPGWTYLDADERPAPHSDRFPDWYWHYCDVMDFVTWGRFEFVHN